MNKKVIITKYKRMLASQLSQLVLKRGQHTEDRGRRTEEPQIHFETRIGTD